MTIRIPLIALLATASLAMFSGCGSGDTNAANNTPTEAAAPAPKPFTPYVISDSSKSIKPTKGLTIYVVEEGKGKLPAAGEKVVVNYHGMFTDGRVFDSSFQRGEPFSFVLGQHQVIEGWDMAFQKLAVGSKAVLVISPELAYGDAGQGTIPPKTTLVFDVDILGVVPA